MRRFFHGRSLRFQLTALFIRDSKNLAVELLNDQRDHKVL